MNILGVSILGHNTGAALIKDGEIAAISEERLNREKHSGAFPELSIEYCLHALNLAPKDIDLVVIGKMGLSRLVNVEKIFSSWNGAERFRKARIISVGHHDAHAASAFFCSPFEEAAILIYDSVGGGEVNQFGVPAYETDTLYRGEGSSLYDIQRTTHLKIGRVFQHSCGIGKLYSILSKSYLNFGSYNEGKMMGLAAYGDDSLLHDYPIENWAREYMGHIMCNPHISFPKADKDTVQNGAKNLAQRILHNLPRTGAFVKWKIRVAGRKLIIFLNQKNLGTQRLLYEPGIFTPVKLTKPRRDNAPLPDSYYSSVAYAAQKILEEVAVQWGRKLKYITGSENICVAGGVGLNIDANRNFLTKVGFKNIFVQPASSDAGIPLGCALYGAHVIEGLPRSWEMTSASLGRPYTEKEVTRALQKYENSVIWEKFGNAAKETAEFVADGKIIGWFEGGAEYGPRALGNRSIVCDPRDPEMKDTLNKRVKGREPWRPFATSVLLEKMNEWFDLKHPSPFMLLDARVREDKKEKIPSVLHVDDTSRLQTVTREHNGKYYEFIRAFYEKTGVPLVLNTSFNLGGEPIVETPEDALSTFTRTNMDYLVLEDYVVQKKS